MARDAKTILAEMAEAVKAGSAKDLNNPQLWINRSFELNLLLIDETERYEDLHQRVAIKKLEIYKAQEKKSATAAKMEVETLDDYRDLKIQENNIDVIKEQIRLAKKNADINN